MKKLLSLLGVTWLSFQMGLAQWVNYPTPGVPQTKDGKPDLSAPTPKTADGKVDLSEIWQIVAAKPKPSEYEYKPSQDLENYMADGATIPWQPWAEALWRKRRESSGAGQPSERCLPPGVPHEVLIPLPFRMVQLPGITFILREEFNHFRQIFTDGRPHRKERNPT
ncbi:MAG: hypothetical protein EXQ47_01610 [Bryobacterales bacterium]|nr:hypothetical protein [Bryobacterales bacterium]